MQTPQIDLLYVHSPITYSIGRHLYDNDYLKNNKVVFCGRNTTWHTPYYQVQDDGVWSTERVCYFLKELCEAVDNVDQANQGFTINAYLPHTGLLLGRILKVTNTVKNIYYIEEGDASYNPELWTEPWPAPHFDIPELISQLDQHGIIDKLQIDRQALALLNDRQACFFDFKHPKYRGAFAISSEAFVGAENVTVLDIQQINIIPESDNIWLCMLPCMTNYIVQYQKNRPKLNEIVYGLITILKTQQAIVEHFNGHMIIKMHPLDEMQLDLNFQQTFYAYGTSYTSFFEMNEFPIGFESSLYNFSQFVVIGASSATRYVKLLQGDDKLISIDL